MIRFECKFCHRLLANVDETKGGKAVIRCPKCGTDNELNLSIPEKLDNN